jgi:methyltransferase (TIGR00027 family)
MRYYFGNQAASPGMHEVVACRTRFFDDCIWDAVKDGCQQVVILGAGYDTRAYRLHLPKQVSFIEIDQPEVQAQKKVKVTSLQLLKNGMAPLGHMVHFIPIDFNTQSLDEVLAKSSAFRSGVKTVWIMEGVSMYIPREAFAATLSIISKLGAPGSRLLTTYADQNMWDAPEKIGDVTKIHNILKCAKAVGEPYITGFHPHEFKHFLAEVSSFTECHQDMGEEEHTARYLVPATRGRIGQKRGCFAERHVCAVKGGVNLSLPKYELNCQRAPHRVHAASFDGLPLVNLGLPASMTHRSVVQQQSPQARFRSRRPSF